jgi:CBS domain containing-hemolysin-like protein
VLRLLLSVTGVGAMAVWALALEPAQTTSGVIASIAIAAGVSAIFLYVLVSVAPISVAEHLGDPLIVRCWPLLRALRVLLAPLVVIARVTDEIVRRLTGAKELSEEEELEEEIRSVVSERSEDGSLDESGRDMIEAVVSFHTRTVEEIMTPRTEIEGIDMTNDLNAVRDFIATAGHSRIPVYEENLDRIAGLLYAKDLLAYLGGDASAFDLRKTLREVRFVPETKRLDELLTEFQRDKVHMAIVLDEYGGTAGLVTIEDVLEEIVGEIYDEYEPETDVPPEIRVIPEERAAVIDARAHVDDVNDELEAIGCEVPEHEDYETIGGYVVTSFGHIPVAGESFRHNGFIITVLEAEPTRVGQVRLELTEDQRHEPERPTVIEPDESAENAADAAGREPGVHG